MLFPKGGNFWNSQTRKIIRLHKILKSSYKIRLAEATEMNRFDHSVVKLLCNPATLRKKAFAILHRAPSVRCALVQPSSVTYCPRTESLTPVTHSDVHTRFAVSLMPCRLTQFQYHPSPSEQDRSPVRSCRGCWLICWYLSSRPFLIKLGSLAFFNLLSNNDNRHHHRHHTQIRWLFLSLKGNGSFIQLLYLYS